MKKVAIITGGSSGIGKCAAQELKNSGWSVYEFSRREKPQEGVFHVCADITDEEQVNRAVSLVWEKEGRIDLLINNAGMGISGAVEFTACEDACRLFDVNFFGAVRMNKAVIPLMRKSGGGRIIHIGSVAGAAPIPFQTYYSASKAALHAYSMALGNELKPFGISVCALMPGDIKTGFTDHREKQHSGDDLYNGRIGRSVAGMEKDEQNGMDPQVAGRFLKKLAQKKRVKPLYSLGFGYRILCILIKLFPSSLLNFILRLLYAR